MNSGLITLHTEGWFDAAHKLFNYEGPCASMHGHTYKVEVWIKGEIHQLDESGLLWDFGNLKKAIKEWDHKDISGLLPVTSCESMVLFLYNKFKKDKPHLEFKVRIYEQLEPKRSWAEIGDF